MWKSCLSVCPPVVVGWFMSWCGCVGVSHIFFSITFPSTIFISHLCHSVITCFIFLIGPLYAECILHQSHIHHTIPIQCLTTFGSVHYNGISSSSSRIIYLLFLGLWSYNCCHASRKLPYLNGAVPCFWHDLQLVCPCRELKRCWLSGPSLLALYASPGAEPEP
jgi:hypothetical protein